MLTIQILDENTVLIRCDQWVRPWRIVEKGSCLGFSVGSVAYHFWWAPSMSAEEFSDQLEEQFP